MSLRYALLPAFVAVASGCSLSGGDTSPTTTRAAETTTAAPTTTREVETGPAANEVDAGFVVIDGDTRRRVAGARVTIGERAGHADTRGRASVRITRREWVRVHVAAKGYNARRLLLRARSSHHVIRLYRPELQWPMYGANPARTQAHPAIKLRPPFRPVWARGLENLVEFPAVVWEGVAYVNNLSGYVWAISMRNGKVLWKKRVGTRMASSPGIATTRRELVTTTMIPGSVSVLDMRTGKVKWSYDLGKSEPSPVVRGKIAYLADTNGNVYALDLARREPAWVYYGGSKITSSPALVGNRLYVGDYSGRVIALDARNGRLLWTGSAGSRVYGTVAVAGGRVFAPSVFSGLSALSASTGALLWRIPAGAYLYSSPAYFRGRVYFGTYAGVVYAADARSGRILWSRSAGGAVSGAVQVVAGVVYAGSFGARITGWDWRTGRELWRFPHGEYVPVSGNGGRLLMHGYSKIWAVEPRKKKKR